MGGKGSGGWRAKTRAKPLDAKKASKSGKVALWLSPETVGLILAGARKSNLDDPEQIVAMALKAFLAI